MAVRIGRPRGSIRSSSSTRRKSSRVVTFILGVAPKEVENVAIDTAEPSSTVAIQGEAIDIRGRIRSQGTKPTKRVVEFSVDGKKKDEKTLEIPPNGEIEVNFTTIPRVDDSNLHQGKIKLSGAPDPYAADDERFFTFRVRPPLKVLLVYDDLYETEHVAAALDPNPSGAVNRPIQVEKVTARELGGRYNGDLQAFAAVFLLNVKRLEEADWSALNRYVLGGGGLVVAPGHLAQPENYNEPTPSRLLPGQLAAEPHTARPTDQHGQRRQPDAPAVRTIRQRPGDRARAGTCVQVLADSGGGQSGAGPLALRRRRTGLAGANVQGAEGRQGAALDAASVSPAEHGGALTGSAAAWNEFPLTEQYGWWFLAIMDRTVPYLSGTASEQLNFDAGENVLLRLDPTARLSNFVISGADQKPKAAAVAFRANTWRCPRRRQWDSGW